MTVISIAFPPLLEARLVDRPNRFVVRLTLQTGSEPVEAHLADPGRLQELLVPGATIWIRPAGGRGRRTEYSTVLVKAPAGGPLVSLDTALPNRIVERALREEALDEFRGYRLVKREFTHGRSRLDFLLARGHRRLAVEVKSVTMVERGVALFPDAVTARGVRHLRHLTALVEDEGWAAALLFVVQRPDAACVEAARSIDPAFADALAQASAAGVRVLGRRCSVSIGGVTLGDRIPAR